MKSCLCTIAEFLVQAPSMDQVILQKEEKGINNITKPSRVMQEFITKTIKIKRVYKIETVICTVVPLRKEHRQWELP